MAIFKTQKKPPAMTAAGKRKTAKLAKAIDQAIEEALTRAGNRFRLKAAELAPTPEDEARLLSQGRILQRVGRQRKGRPAEDTVGTPEGGRFRRIRGMKSMQTALRTAPVEVSRTKAGFVVRVGDIRKINQITGFYWMVKRNKFGRPTLEGPTRPFDRKLLQAYENGGTWIVTRRTENLLNPAPKVYAGRMLKTLPRIAMLRQAKALTATRNKQDIDQSIRRAMKRVERAG